MPYTSDWVEPLEFLTYMDVTVYHTYKNCEASQGHHDYWYTTCIDDTLDDHHFDIRELRVSAARLRPRPEDWEELACQQAIELGLLLHVPSEDR